MRLTTIISLLLLTALAVLGPAGCKRNPGAGRPTGTATHPWELGDQHVASGLPEVERAPVEEFDPRAEVDSPTLPGPAWSATDTLDPERMAGLWYPVCNVRDEIMRLTPLDQVVVLQLEPDGKVVFQAVNNGEVVNSVDGYWAKAAAGKISMGIAGNDPKVSNAEMYGDGFLYIWDYDIQIGSWYVRLPQEASQTIDANRFDTTRGELVFTSVVGQSYEGYCQGVNKLDLRGLYTNGILTMRWEDQQGNLGGFAAFTVDPGWQALDGVWWVDDYEAAPFGGPWTGTKLAGEPAGE